MNVLRKSVLLFHTVRYLSLKQVAYRVKAVTRKRWWQVRNQKAPLVHSCLVREFRSLYEGLQDPMAVDLAGLMVTPISRAIGISEGRFYFLNREVRYKNDINWHDSEVSQLWRYHLHYFEYLQDLIIWSSNGNDEKAWGTFKVLSSSWISKNGFLIGDGWHPYTVSLRIVNWLNGFGYWRNFFDEHADFRSIFLASLYGQARFLAANLEHDVRGNHLLKNIKALLWAGIAFSGKESFGWYRKALVLLEQELAEQVLPDGGHFERVPGYHGTVLKDCLEMSLWLKGNRYPVPAWLDAGVLRMLSYLRIALPADGQLPLLKDTAWEAFTVPLDVLSTGALYLNCPEFKIAKDYGLYPWLLFGFEGREEFQHFDLSKDLNVSTPLFDSGFFVLRDDKQKDYLIFDVGKPCPDYLPAHAHADMFSYELSVAGQRVVVDSGVYEYSAGKWRDFFRSTRAHNTVEINGTNQSEIWGSFRVARRAQPGPVLFENGKDRVVIDAWHDGYQRLGIPAFHRRVLWWEKEHFWFVCDEIYGSGQVQTKSLVHLHPSLMFKPSGRQQFQIHKGKETVLQLSTFENEAFKVICGREEEVIQGWYSEEFGKKVPNFVLSLEKDGELPFCFGYVIHEADDFGLRYFRKGSRLHSFEVVLQDKVFFMDISPNRAVCHS